MCKSFNVELLYFILKQLFFIHMKINFVQLALEPVILHYSENTNGKKYSNS